MNWCMNGKDHRRSGFVGEVIGFPLVQVWSTELAPDVSIPHEALITRDRVFITIRDTLFCLDIHTGKRLWRVSCKPSSQRGPENFIKATPAVTDERVFFSDWLGNLYCVDTGTGKQLWNRDGLGAREGAIAIADDLLIIQTERDLNSDKQGGIHALDLDGNQRWFADVEADIWTSGGAVSGDLLIVGAANGYFSCFNVRTGEMVYRVQVRDFISIKYLSKSSINPAEIPKIIDNFVFVSIGNSNAVAVFDLSTGCFRWSHVADMGGFGWALDRKGVYYMNHRNIFRKLSLENGIVEMEMNLNTHNLGIGWSSNATIIGNTCFVSFTHSNKVAAIDTVSGTPVWIHEDQSPIFVPVSYAHGYLIFGNGTGQVRCFASKVKPNLS